MDKFYVVELYRYEFPYGKNESKSYYFNSKELALDFIKRYACVENIDLNNSIAVYKNSNDDEGISMNYSEVEFCNEIPKLNYGIDRDFVI